MTDQFDIFLQHAKYLDNIDISSIGKGVKNRLRKHVDFWEHIGASEFVIQTIKTGYVIPFLKNPPPMAMKNNKSALFHSDFVDVTILDLLDTGCIVETPFQPFVVNPLSVSVQSSGKKRLILDLSELNNFIRKDRVKFEDWRVALNYFKKDSFLFKFDLKSGYFHFDLSAKQQTYLGFSWKNKFYCFTVLAFGLTSAPYLFTKCLKPLVKYWRENGINIVLYLDDGLGIADTKTECKINSDLVKSSLCNAGFLINEEKSLFNPVQSLEWLGLMWNSVNFSIFIPERRINDTLSSLREILSIFPKFSARKLAQVTGKIMSMSPVMGGITCLLTRYLYNAIENRTKWDLFLDLEFPDFVLNELYFWSRNISVLNQKRLANYTLPTKMVYSDASNVAAGAFMVEVNDCVFHQMWSLEEAQMSSTWRELKAVYLAMCSFKSKLTGHCVKWHTDNQNCISIIQKGSTKLHLQTLAMQIFVICSRYRISLDITWVPRSKNSKADYISKMVDIEDWGTTPEFFSFIDSLWGPHTIDRFASNINKKLKRYNSKFWNPDSEAIDAFSQNWFGENNWIVPPISLVNRAIKHLLHCKSEGTLIVPRWPSSPFWTMIFKEGLVYHSYVSEVLEFEPKQNFFIHGMNKKSIFGSDTFNSKVLAVRLVARSQ